MRGSPDVLTVKPTDPRGNELDRAPLSYHEAVTLHKAGRGSEIPLDQFGTPHDTDAVYIGVTGAATKPTVVTEPIPQVDESQFTADERAILSMIPDTRQRHDAAMRMRAAKQDRPNFADDGGTYLTDPGDSSISRRPSYPLTEETAEPPAYPRASGPPANPTRMHVSDAPPATSPPTNPRANPDAV